MVFVSSFRIVTSEGVPRIGAVDGRSGQFLMESARTAIGE